MTGKLSVSSSEEFDADELRIELWVTEETTATGSVRVGSESRTVTVNQKNEIHKGKDTVAGRMKVTEGFNQQFPFSIPIPSGVPPTYCGRFASNTWRMKGVIAVKGRLDVTGHIMEVQITPYLVLGWQIQAETRYLREGLTEKSRHYIVENLRFKGESAV